MKRMCNLGTLVGAPNATITESLTNLPEITGSDQYRVCEFILKVTGGIPEGQGDDLEWLNVLEQIRALRIEGFLTRFIDLTGLELRDFLWYTARNYEGVEPAAVVAPNAGQIAGYMTIPVEVPEHKDGKQFDVPAALFSGANIVSDFGDFNVVAGTDMNLLTIELWATLERRRKTAAVALPEIGAVTLDSFGRLPAGIYSDLFIRRPADDWTSADDIQNIMISVPDEMLLKNVDADGVCAAYCYDKGHTSGGIMSVYFAADCPTWEKDYDNADFLPLIWLGQAGNAGNDSSRMVDTRGAELRLDIQGDLTQIPVVYRRYRPVTATEGRRQFEKLGIVRMDMIQTARLDLMKRPMGTPQVQSIPGALTIPLTVTGVRDLSAVDPSLRQVYRTKIVKSPRTVVSEPAPVQSVSAAYLPGLY